MRLEHLLSGIKVSVSLENLEHLENLESTYVKKGTNKVTILVFSQISLYLYISSERKWNGPRLQFKSALLFLVLDKRNNDL